MTVTRESKGEKAIMIIEVDDRIEGLTCHLKEIDGVDEVSFFG
jgi:L-serine dehydratase